MDPMHSYWEHLQKRTELSVKKLTAHTPTVICFKSFLSILRSSVGAILYCTIDAESCDAGAKLHGGKIGPWPAHTFARFHIDG
jgi:hypothetical protein